MSEPTAALDNWQLREAVIITVRVSNSGESFVRELSGLRDWLCKEGCAKSRDYLIKAWPVES